MFYKFGTVKIGSVVFFFIYITNIIKKKGIYTHTQNSKYTVIRMS